MKQLLTNIDFWGGSTSLLCAVHCALLPVCLSVGLISGQHWILTPAVELTIMAVTLVFVFSSIIRPYFQNRQFPVSFYLAVVGLILISIHHMIEQYSAPIIVAGGILVASAHIFKLISQQLSQSTRTPTRS